MSLQDYKNSNDIRFLIAKLFECRQVAHNVHLQTKSYSQHEALKNFYEKLLDFADDLIETYQGQYGIVTGYEKLIQLEPVKEVDVYLEDCCKIFNAAKSSLKDSHLKNTMEEIISLTYSTIYKIKNLG
jgi:hypothetical protein